MIQDLINSREIKAVIFDYDNTISDENPELSQKN